jgi:hypothetical protein
LKRKLWLFNFLLIAAIALAGWQLRKEARELRAREHGILDKHTPIPSPPAQPPALPAPTVTAAAYIEIADKLLLSKDRNSKVIVDPPKPPDPPKPLPPLPAVYGVMNIGDGPTVMMSEKSGGRQRGVHPGEKIGEFKLVSANSDELVLAFENRTVKKKVDELLDRGGTEAVVAAGGPAGGASASNTPPPPPPVGKAEPGVKLGDGLSNCQSNDSSPAGTIANGMRKVIRQTPFDTACYWEAVK